MKKIFVLGGMAAALLISACGGEESKEEPNENKIRKPKSFVLKLDNQNNI